MNRILFFLAAFFLSVLFSQGCNANEPNIEDMNRLLPGGFVKPEPAKKFDKGYIQKGFYRVVTYTHDEDGYYRHREDPNDANRYGRPPLNYDDLPDFDGNIRTMSIKTSVGDVNVEYQMCRYDDNLNPYDPCTDPNILMDWKIEKVNVTASGPIVDMSGFYMGDYYVMQWKIKLPPNCKALDSFADWLPNNVGIFMTKYAEKNGFVYYISNPLVFSMSGYEKIGGTYIGNDEIHSYIPHDNNEPNNSIKLHYDKFYHPLNDITKDICIENHCYKYYYYMFSCK